MFIVTKKGNYVPMTNVKVIKPHREGGSLVMLRSGDSFKDDRDPATIFSELPASQDMGVVVDSIYSELNTMKDKISTVYNKLEAQVEVATSSVASATAELENNIAKLSSASSAHGRTTQDLKSVVRTVEIQSRELENAIQEAISG